MTRSADSDFDLLADDSVNGFTRLFIASKEDDIGRGHKIQSMVRKTSSRNFENGANLRENS